MKSVKDTAIISNRARDLALGEMIFRCHIHSLYFKIQNNKTKNDLINILLLSFPGKLWGFKSSWNTIILDMPGGQQIVIYLFPGNLDVGGYC